MPLRSAYATYMGETPSDRDGPRAIYAPASMLAVSGGSASEYDLSQDAQAQKMRFLQNVFIDADQIAANAKLTFRVLSTGYVFRVRGSTQGWYPLVATDDMRFRLEGAAAAIGLVLPLWFSNVPGLMTSWNTA